MKTVFYLNVNGSKLTANVFFPEHFDENKHADKELYVLQEIERMQAFLDNNI